MRRRSFAEGAAQAATYFFFALFFGAAAFAAALAGFAAVAAEELDIPAKLVDPAEGLFYACLQKGGRRTGAEKLAALYLRRSSAEENAK